MKIIDLLNKIANGEEVPKKIRIETHIFTKYNYLMGNGTSVPSYDSNNDGEYHINDFLYPQYLNEEVEIIEEQENKKIEKLKIIDNGSKNSYALLNEYGTKCALTRHSKIMCDKINELVEEINKLKESNNE